MERRLGALHTGRIHRFPDRGEGGPFGGLPEQRIQLYKGYQVWHGKGDGPKRGNIHNFRRPPTRIGTRDGSLSHKRRGQFFCATTHSDGFSILPVLLHVLPVPYSQIRGKRGQALTVWQSKGNIGLTL